MQKQKNFIKVKEDFICENCGKKIKGTGYTNHCPDCLWSRHVDLRLPGDRLSKCKGLMEPIGAEYKSKEWIITHKCQKCGLIRKNKANFNDSKEKLIELSTNSILNNS